MKEKLENQPGEVRPPALLSPPPEEIRAHLEQLLRSPHFKNSKRCQSLLNCSVEQALEGNAELLKERTLGVMAFGRDPAYDTNQDAVVRNVAMEVRKRLAQFYQDAGHGGGVRIDLPAGSYVPEFRLEAARPEAKDAPPPVAARPLLRRWRIWIAAAVSVAILAAVAAFVLREKQGTPFDRFWAPLLSRSSVVQICVGQPAEVYAFRGPRKVELDRSFNVPNGGEARTPVSASEVAPVARRYLWRRDAFCMARIAAFLGSRGASFRLRSESDAPYAELRGSPLIMIGAFDWRGQIRMRDRRFGFGNTRIDGVDYKYVRDRQRPDDQRWKFPLSFATQEASEYDDYGIITRELTSASEKAIVSVVGATDYSTLAAGEFLVNPSYIGAALRATGTGWEHKNIQVVVRTRIIQGVPGPPSAVAIHTW